MMIFPNDRGDLKITRCDAEGVPCLIQWMRYHRGSMQIEARFFNGESILFVTEIVCPDIELLAKWPTPAQWDEAENTINLMAEKNWREWFPYNHLRSVS